MYDGLPPQLSGDALQALRDHLRRVIELRDEIKELTKPTGHGGYQLSDYVDRARQRLIDAYHGERDRFYYPYAVALNRLDQLQEVETAKLNGLFSTHKIRLLAALNRYVKSLQAGFHQSDSETGLAPPQ